MKRFIAGSMVALFLLGGCSQAQKPDSQTPETVQPETAQSETAQPETVQPEIAQSETAQPETVQPETAQPETVQPEIAQSETVQPQAAQPETVQPQAAQPETVQPQANGVSLGGNSENTMITTEEAKEKALAHAGLAADQVTFAKNRLDWEDGRQVYELEFYTSDYKEYDYEVDPYTGQILSYDYEAESFTPPAGAESGTVSAEQAKQIALAQVPGAAESNMRKFETDYDDGRLEYEVEIIYNEMEYEFEIDGYSGEIRSWEAESIYD